MSRVTAWSRWPGEHPAVGLDLVRMFLGIALFARGVLFIQHPEILMSYIQRSGSWFWPLMLAQYVGLAHLSGGGLLILGLCTRWAALAQVPVLFGAVFIGAEPQCSWLPDTVMRDKLGYILTGTDALRSGRWPLRLHSGDSCG